jgi:serine/threonine protein kinase
MSVERLAGDDSVDPRSDVYAAGVTLFECLAGDVPFAGSLADVVRQVMPVDAEPARLRVPGVPASIARVIERACARRQEDRYQNMDDFRRDLVAGFGREPQLTLLDDTQAARRPPVVPSVESPARRKHARAPYTTPVRLTTATGPVDGRSEDISAGGMLIISRSRPKVDEKVVTRFALPIEGRVASVRGTVRWIRGGEKGPAAIGVEFDEADSSLVTSIERYIEVMSRLG